MVSPVVNFDGTDNIPPHSTGAAIDVQMINTENVLVEMGINIEDWKKDLDGTLSLTDSSRISDEAKKNRSILSAALTAVGFVNYPTEYWRWSYGDRYWAYHKNEENALYGCLQRLF